jgi:hypothetical protein
MSLSDRKFLKVYDDSSQLPTNAKVGSLAAVRSNGVTIIACRLAAGWDIWEAGAMQLDDAILDGAKAAVLAEDSIIGGLPVVHVIDKADGASGDKDVILTHKTRILRVEVIKTAGAGAATNTLTVKNADDAITDALDMNVADKVIVHPTTIDDAYWEVAAGGTLRVSHTKAGGNSACKVVVHGVRVA